MKKLSNLKILVVIALIAIIMGINTMVAYATETPTNLSTISESGSTNETSDTSTINEIDTAGDIKDENNTAEDNTIVLENEVPDKEIPDAGKEDTVLLVLIGIVVVSSIYTYSKVKKYNI